eukprot:1929049-Rhodomonas_salina.1
MPATQGLRVSRSGAESVVGLREGPSLVRADVDGTAMSMHRSQVNLTRSPIQHDTSSQVRLA